MNSLLGVELPTPVNFVIAFIVVLALIGAATWLIRRFGATRLDAAARGRQPRLAVIDTAAVDNRRKLVIIRRDNVEHLLMIGGPTDVVVETSIVRTGAATRDATRETTPAVGAAIETLPRAVPLPDPTPWPLQPEPAPAAAPVRVRTAPRAVPELRIATEQRVAPEPRAVAPEPRIVADEPAAWPTVEPQPAPAAPVVRAPQRVEAALTGFANELARPAPAPTVHHAPAPVVVAHAPVAAAPEPVAVAEPVPAAADQNLADMAQRLEAALRRPMTQAQAPQPVAQPAPQPAAQPAPAAPRVVVAQAKPAQPQK